VPTRQKRNGAKQVAPVGVARLMKRLLDEAHLDKLARAHHGDPRRHLRHR
jgi:hypothetical protein